MAKYIDCFIGNDGCLHIGNTVKKKENKFKAYLRNAFKDFKPKIIMNKKEVEALGGDILNNPKGFFVRSSEGIRIPVLYS